MIRNSYFVVAYGPAYGSVLLVREQFDSLRSASARFAALADADTRLPASRERTFRMMAEFHADRALDSVTDQELRMLPRVRGVLPDGLARVHACQPKHVPHPVATALANSSAALAAATGLFLPKPIVIDAETGVIEGMSTPVGTGTETDWGPVVFEYPGQFEEYVDPSECMP